MPTPHPPGRGLTSCCRNYLKLVCLVYTYLPSRHNRHMVIIDCVSAPSVRNIVTLRSGNVGFKSISRSAVTLSGRRIRQCEPY